MLWSLASLNLPATIKEKKIESWLQLFHFCGVSELDREISIYEEQTSFHAYVLAKYLKGYLLRFLHGPRQICLKIA